MGFNHLGRLKTLRVRSFVPVAYFVLLSSEVTAKTVTKEQTCWHIRN